MTHKQTVVNLTRLPSNLRPTTRECLHLVTRDHFRSRDKDGGHTIRAAIGLVQNKIYPLPLTFWPKLTYAALVLSHGFLVTAELIVHIMFAGHKVSVAYAMRKAD